MDLPFNQEIILEKILEASWDKEASSVASNPMGISVRNGKDPYGESSQGGRKGSGIYDPKRPTRHHKPSVSKGRFEDIVESMVSQEED